MSFRPTKAFDCGACRDTGWVHFKRTVRKLTNMPWSAACLCERGRYLSSDREWPPGRNDRRGEKPVKVQPVDRELYYRRLQEYADANSPTPETNRRDIQ